MLETTITLAFAIIGISALLCFARLLKGPDLPDRILALDTLYTNTIALIVLFGLHLNSKLYFEAGLVIAIIGFISTIAFSKYLLRGDIME